MRVERGRRLVAALAALALGAGCGTTPRGSASESKPASPVAALDPGDLAQGRLCGFPLDGAFLLSQGELERAKERKVIASYQSDDLLLQIWGDDPAGLRCHGTIFFKGDGRGGRLEPHEADHAVFGWSRPATWPPASSSPAPRVVELVKVDFGVAREQVLRTSWPDVYVRRRPGQKEWSGLTWTRHPERTFKLRSGSVADTFARAREARAAGRLDLATELLKPFASVEPELLPRAETEPGPATAAKPAPGGTRPAPTSAAPVKPAPTKSAPAATPAPVARPGAAPTLRGLPHSLVALLSLKGPTLSNGAVLAAVRTLVKRVVPAALAAATLREMLAGGTPRASRVTYKPPQAASESELAIVLNRLAKKDEPLVRATLAAVEGSLDVAQATLLVEDFFVGPGVVVDIVARDARHRATFEAAFDAMLRRPQDGKPADYAVARDRATLFSRGRRGFGDLPAAEREVYAGLVDAAAAKVLRDLGPPPSHLAKHVPASEVSFAGAVVSLAISPNGRWLATGTNDRVGLYRLDAERGTLTDAGSLEADHLQQGVRFTRDGEHLLCVNAVGRLRLFRFDASTGRGTEAAKSISIPAYRTASSHFEPVVKDLELKFDGEMAFVSWTVLTQGLHGSITRVDLDRAKGVLRYWGDLYPPSPAGCAALALEGARVLAGTKVYAPGRGRAYDVAELPYGSDWSGVPSSLAASGSLVAAGHHESLVVFRFGGPRYQPTRLGRLPVPGGTVERLLFSDGARRLLACSKDGKVRVLSLELGGTVDAVFDHPGSVTALARSPDGRWVVTAATDGRLRVWRADLDVPSRPLEPGPAITVRGLPDEAWPLLEPALALERGERLEKEPALDFAAALLRASAPAEAVRVLLEAALGSRPTPVEVVFPSGARRTGRLGGPREPEATFVLRAARDALAGEPTARHGSVLADPERPLAVAALAARDAAGAALATDLVADRLRPASAGPGAARGESVEARARFFTSKRPEGATEAEAAALEAATGRAVAKAGTDAQ